MERHDQLTSLLRVSRAIASISEPSDLLRVIISKIKPLFDFHDVGLFVVNEAENYHTDLASVMPEISPSEGNQQVFARDAVKIPHRDSVVDGCIRRIEEADGPLLFDFVNLAVQFPDYPHWDLALGMGYRDCLATTLKVRGERIGMFCLNALEKNKLAGVDREFFQQIADQIAITLGHLMARDAVLAEKQKVEQLLTISQAITKIKDRKQLLGAIYERIKPIIPYDAYGLFVLTEDGQYHYDLIDADILDHSVQVAIEQQYGAYALYPHPDSVIEMTMQQGPMLIRLADHLDYVQSPIMYEGGMRHIIAGPLIYGGEAIGMLCFISKQEDFYTDRQLPLFDAISQQLSIATANVLANERLIQEKQFTETLLRISEVMTTIQHRHQLRAAFARIAEVFPFEGAGLFVLTPEGKQHYELLDSETLAGEATQSRVEAQFGKHAYYPHTGSPIEMMMQTNRVALYRVDDLLSRFPHYSQNEAIQESGFQQVIAAPLYQGEQVIGLLNFNSKLIHRYLETDFPLVQAIGEQMSRVVSNILVNEQVQQQERENALQVAIVNSLNAGTSWEEKLRGIVPHLLAFVPFDLITIVLNTERVETMGYAFERIGYDEYRTLDIPSLLQLIQLDRTIFLTHITKGELDKPLILNGEDFVQATRSSPVKRAIQQTLSMNSMMAVPMKVGGKRVMYVTFHSKNVRTYTISHQALLSRIEFSFTLSVEKQVNYQEVVRLNELIEQENQYLEEELKLTYNSKEIIGGSEAMRHVFEQVHLVANSNSSVLITGETGTGKELIARALHYDSHRRDHTFVRLNCATLPVQLLESELFGHERGAFTGAVQRRVGKFELAHKGTIFLDEIGEMPVELQVKLLRVLQEREFERLGGNEVIRTDVRIVAATNRDLPQAIVKNQFRPDLYYRLNVFPIHLPPLRERKEDIPELAHHFIQKHGRRTGKSTRKLSEATLRMLLAYAWPGNIRELEHVIERALITSKTDTLSVEVEKMSTSSALTDRNGIQPLKTYQQGEIDLIMNTLRVTKGKISGVGGAAEILDIHPSTLESRMRKLGIRRQHGLEK